jgi:hypothetical protein
MTASTAQASSAIDSQLTTAILPAVKRALGGLNIWRGSADIGGMNSAAFVVPYLVLWTALMRALLVRAEVLPPTCTRCGLKYERRHMGEVVCRCT